MQCHDLLNLWGDDDPMLSYPQQVPFPPNGDAHSEDRLDSINMNGVFDVEDLLNGMLDADSTLVPTITMTVAPLVFLYLLFLRVEAYAFLLTCAPLAGHATRGAASSRYEPERAVAKWDWSI